MSELIRVGQEFDQAAGLIYADLPFGTGKKQSGLAGSYSDTFDSAVEFMHQVKAEPSATTILHCDQRLKWEIAKHYGPPDREIIWHYKSGGASKNSLPQKTDTLMVYTTDRSFYSPVRVSYSQNMAGLPAHPEGKMVSTSWTDIGIMSTSSKERVGYPTQKPLKLMERVLRMWCDPKIGVFDPCMGSGTTLLAAKALGYNALGKDINPEAFEVALKRLA